MRAIELADAPERHVGRTVIVDIVEPLRSVADNMLAVQLPEHESTRLALVASTDVAPPVRVRGEVAYRFPHAMFQPPNTCCFVLNARSIERLTPGPAEKAPVIEAILADRARWDRKRVIYEGLWTEGFERSSLDGRIWLSLSGDARFVAAMRSTPDAAGSADDDGDPLVRRRTKVRVEGMLFAHDGAMYGHLGGYPIELLASKLEAL